MKCSICRKEIQRAELKRCVIEHDEGGALKGAKHDRCARQAARQAGIAAAGTQPGVYELEAYSAGGADAVAAARAARDVVEAERAADPGFRPAPWNDWREQAEVELESAGLRTPEGAELGWADLGLDESGGNPSEAVLQEQRAPDRAAP